MSTPARIAAFLAGLVVVFALGWGAGNAFGPLEEPPPAPTGVGEEHPSDAH